MDFRSSFRLCIIVSPFDVLHFIRSLGMTFRVLKREQVFAKRGARSLTFENKGKLQLEHDNRENSLSVRPRRSKASGSSHRLAQTLREDKN